MIVGEILQCYVEMVYVFEGNDVFCVECYDQIVIGGCFYCGVGVGVIGIVGVV